MIIAISGKLNSGKDTVASMIQALEAWNKNKNNKESLFYLDMKEGKLSQEQFVLDFINPDNVTYSRQKWETKRWADTLKDIVCMLIGCTREQLEDREFKEKPLGEEWWYYKRDYAVRTPILISYLSVDEDPCHHKDTGLVKLTPRKLLQLLGTEAGREIIHPNIWVNALMADYKVKEEKEVDLNEGINHNLIYPKWIIPDTRFPNEAKAVRERDGILIRINRLCSTCGEMPPSKFCSACGNQTHPSEVSLDNWNDWDYVIENDGSLEDLLLKVKEIYEEISGN